MGGGEGRQIVIAATVARLGGRHTRRGRRAAAAKLDAHHMGPLDEQRRVGRIAPLVLDKAAPEARGGREPLEERRSVGEVVRGASDHFGQGRADKGWAAAMCDEAALAGADEAVQAERTAGRRGWAQVVCARAGRRGGSGESTSDTVVVVRPRAWGVQGTARTAHACIAQEAATWATYVHRNDVGATEPQRHLRRAPRVRAEAATCCRGAHESLVELGGVFNLCGARAHHNARER